MAEGAQVVCADVDGQAAAMTALMLGGTRGRRCYAPRRRGTDRRGGVPPDRFARHRHHEPRVFDSTPFSEIEPDEWDRVQAVNLRGTFLVCRAALKTMARHRGGAIVTVGSLAGRVSGLHAGASYAASNAGVVALTKSLAGEAGPLGIRVNCVQPGFIATPRTETWSDESRHEVIGRTPLGRIGEPEEVAAAVVWLASDHASFVSGAHLDVSGGLHMD
jgi:NAD(P)-dependent dehydrogenase (short-subunit alcohol dehydrogenase family)